MVVEYNLDVEEECPLCIELLNHDLNFFPCECAFQICSICWNRIKELEGNLCPNCRTPYSEEPFSFKQLTEKQEALIVQRDQRSNNNSVPAVVKPKIAAIQDKEKLRDVRVMQKNLVFVVGLQPKLADESALRKQEYFGRFGKIMKVAVNQCTTYAGVQGPSASAYVTFATTDAALKCIQMVHGLTQDGRTLKATLGTTKYCSRFLNGQQCKLTDCMYLHEIADPDASFTKEDMQKQKHTEYERRLMDNFRRAQQAEQARKEAAERDRRLREQLRKKEEAAEASRKKAAAKVTPRQEAKRPRKPPTTPTAASVTAKTTVTIPKQNQNPRSRPAPPKPKSPKVQIPKKNIYVDSDDEAEIERFPSKKSKDAVEEDVKDSWDTSDEEDCHKSSNSGKSSKSSSKPTSRAPSRNATPADLVDPAENNSSYSHSNSRPNSRSSKSSSNHNHDQHTPLFENNTQIQSQSVTNQHQHQSQNSKKSEKQQMQSQTNLQSQATVKPSTNGKTPPPNLDPRKSSIGRNLFGNGDYNSRTIPSPIESADEQMPSQPTNQFRQPVQSKPVSNRLQARSPVEPSLPSGLMFDPFALNNVPVTTQSRLGAPPGVSKANRSPPGFGSSSSNASSFPLSSNHNSQSTSSHQPFNPFDSFFSQDSVKLQDTLPNTNSQVGSLFNRLPTVDQLKDPFARKPAVQTNGPGLVQGRKDWESSSGRAGVSPSSLSRRVPPAGLFDTGSSLSSTKLVPGLDGVDPLLFAGGSGRVDPPASSLMPRPIPDLLRNGDSGMGRSRQDSADLENLDFDPIDYSMKGLSKLQLNEPRARRTHATSPQQPNRSLFGDLQAPIGMMGLFGEQRQMPRQQSGKDEGHWQENLRRLLPNVNVHFQYSEQMQNRQAASSYSDLKPQLPRGPPGLGGPPGFSQKPLLGFPDAGNAFVRQNSRQPFESEFIPKGLLD